jgi:hypothetical protein
MQQTASSKVGSSFLLFSDLEKVKKDLQAKEKRLLQELEDFKEEARWTLEDAIDSFLNNLLSALGRSTGFKWSLTISRGHLKPRFYAKTQEAIFILKADDETLSEWIFESGSLVRTFPGGNGVQDIARTTAMLISSTQE